MILERLAFDVRKSRWEPEQTFILPDGRRHTRRMSVRLYTLAEVESLFRRHGLAIKEIYGDWSGEGYTANSRRMIVLAEREH